MPDAVTLKINLPDFLKQMRGFSERTQKQHARAAASAGAKVFIRLAKQNARVSSKANRDRVPGALRRNIIQIKSRFHAPNEIVYNVGVRTKRFVQRRMKSKVKQLLWERKGDPFYWYFLEGGWIPRGPGKKLRGGERARSLQRQRLLASGARKVRYEFLAPAFRGGKELSVRAAIAEMDKRIAKENARER